MTLHDPIKELLQYKRTLIIDGALATELEARGCDLKGALWSARILISEPVLIGKVHFDYFCAGADITITASYQASPRGLREVCGLSEAEASALIAKSVTLAQEARDQVLVLQPTRRMLVAGSVGPYGAYLSDGSEYRGDYILPESELREFHYLRVKALVDAGVDLLACETLPSFAELKAILGLIHDEFPATPSWCSFTLREDGCISDGTCLENVCAELNKSPQVVAIGVNCVAQDQVGPALKRLRKLTNKPLLAYPNSGEVYDAVDKIWISPPITHPKLTEMASSWVEDGAELIGGCCRIGPEDIEKISKTLGKENPP